MENFVSIIVPAYNEEGNIEPLLQKLNEMIERYPGKYEVILIDDGSADKTLDVALNLQQIYSFLRIVKHRKNFGLTQALVSGNSVSKGDAITLFPADLQFDVNDIPLLNEKLREGFDIVTGKKAGKYKKQFVSSIYNTLSRKLFHLPITDQNSIKIMKKEVMDSITLRKDWHRYIVSIAMEKGFSVTEIPVRLYPRYSGNSKFTGFGRIVIGIFDLIAVKIQTSLIRKPMLLFGAIGGALLGLGILIGLVSVIVRIFWHFGYRPVVYLTMILVIAGLLLFIFGFIAEILATIIDKIEKPENFIDKIY